MQALDAYPNPSNDDGTLSDAFRKATIHRLNGALERLARSDGTAAIIGRRGLQIVRDAYAVLHSRIDFPYGEVHTHLDSVRSALCDWSATDDAASRDDERWLQLGLEIADGYGEPASDGQLTRCDEPSIKGRPALFPDHLKSANPRPATWEWKSLSRVQHLLGEVAEAIGNLFPSYDSLTPKDRAVFPSLPGSLWSWCALEVGLRRLRDRANQTTAAASPRRKRGRQPNPKLRERNRLILQAHHNNPTLGNKGLALLLCSQHSNYHFSTEIVRHVVRPHPDSRHGNLSSV
jgi:hypothetical protein